MRAIQTFLRPLTALLSVAVLVLAACGDEPQSITAPDSPGPVLAIGVDSTTGASIETSKDDYVPGEIVHLVLKGWAPGEDVRLVMTEEPDTHGDVDTTVTVDANGDWSGHFYDVQEHDLGVTFTLTATGQTSKSSATAVFYDGTISGATLALGTTPAPPCTAASGPYTVGQSLCAVATLTITGGGNTVGRILWTKGSTEKASTSLGANPLGTTQYSSYSPDAAGTDWAVKVCSNLAGTCNQVRALTFTVGAADVATATTVVSGTNPSVTGQSVTFTATVLAGVTPVTTGTVDFRLGGSDCTDGTVFGDDVALSGSGQATANQAFSATQTGATIRACYSGATGFATSSGTTTQTVNKANTLVTISDDSPDPSVSGQSVTLSATVAAVAPGAGTPTGTVTFYASGTCLAPGTSLGSDNSSPWSISTSALTLAGSPYTLLACYGGDDNFNGNGDTEAHTVTAIETATTVGGSPNPSVTGQSVTFTATVLAGATPVTTGTVDFRLGGTDCTTGTVFGDDVVLDGSGQATANQAFNATQTGATIRACYSGGGEYGASSGTTTQTVNKANTLVTLSDSPATTVFGQSVTLSATVTAVAPGAGTPTGTVNFYDGGSCGAPGNLLGFDTSSPWSIATSSLAAAASPYTLLACYGGDDNFNGNGDTEEHTVNKADTEVTLAATPDPSTFGQGVSLSATVAAVAPGAGTPAGTVTFYDGGSCGTPGNSLGSDASSPWEASVSTLDAGSYTLLACYSGNANFNGSGDTEAHTVNPAPVTVAASVPTTTPQYSDEVTLRAAITSDLTINSSTVTGDVYFYFRSPAFGSCPATAPASGYDATDAIDGLGVAEADFKVTGAPGSYTLTACFYSSNPNFANSSDTESPVTVGKENASVAPGTPYGNAFPISGTTASFTLTFLVRETNPEPDQNAGAFPGDLDGTGLTVTLNAVGSGANNTSVVCSTSGSITTPAYSDVKTYSCNFTGVAVDAYEVGATVTGDYYVGSYGDALTVYDPGAGFVTGGGKFVYPGSTDRVSFGLVFNFTGKGKTLPRGNLVVIRHMANGDVCRAKSNAIDAPAVVGKTASFSGKGNYGCTRPNGTTYDGIGNQVITGWVEDNGQGSTATAPDRIWIRMAVPNSNLLMTTPASTNAAPLTGGNIQVPQPQGGK